MMRLLPLAAGLCLIAGSALANDRVLILGSEDYDALGRVPGAADAVDLSDDFLSRGVAFAGRADPTANEMRMAALEFANVRGDGAAIAVLSGHFATDGERTWYLATTADVTNIFDVEQRGLSVESVLKVLAAAPGEALLVIGTQGRESGDFDRFLTAGVGPLTAPQGVTIVTGSIRQVNDLMEEIATTPRTDIIAEARNTRGMEVTGFKPDRLVLLDGRAEDAPGLETAERNAERAAWAAARLEDSAQGYSSYLDRYPRGENAAEARRMLDEIRNEPNRAARLAEEALNLGRDARRAIQRDLVVLRYDTRGIDGIFGPGSRRAITNWQQQNGFSQTGYLTAEQITRLDAQAARRQQELEAEAERKRRAAEAQDRAFWEETGDGGDEAGLRAYLQRYPEGLFSERAEAQLARIEDAKRADARREDRQDWDRARERDNVDAYRAYLNAQPRGAFRDAAEARIAALQENDRNAGARADAASAEQALGLDPLALRLIEARLEQLGLEPGAVDGQFDNSTRRAIRRYQRDRDLDRTGYLNADTVSRLLRDVFR